MTTTLERNTTKRDTPRTEYVLPPVNIREDKDAYVLEAEMPGVNKDLLEVSVEGSELTILGHRPPEPAKGTLLLRERRPVDFRRVFEIDPAIDTTGIRATMQQGLLTLTLPKSERVKPRRIEVAG